MDDEWADKRRTKVVGMVRYKTAADERCGFLLACSEGLLAPEGGEEEHGDRQDLQSSQQHAE